MRDWVADIDDAMRRGDSPFSADDVLKWLRTGEAHMVVAPHLHGSVRYYAGDDAEVGHMAGEWCAHCADYVITGLSEHAKGKGLESVRIEGRKGWQRFLRIKGIRT